MAKVLIADDSRLHVHLLTGWLEESGVEVLPTFDSVQASIKAMRIQPDVIVLDINMPGGSGLDVLKRLKSSDKTKAIPVVVVSGTGSAEMRELVQRLGAAEFLEKPLEHDKFCSLVAGLMPRRGVRR